MLVNHRASTPKWASMQPECKECPLLDIDEYTWQRSAYWNSNNFTCFWTKEYFHTRFRTSNLHKTYFQYSIFRNQIKLQSMICILSQFFNKTSTINSTRKITEQNDIFFIDKIYTLTKQSEIHRALQFLHHHEQVQNGNHRCNQDAISKQRYHCSQKPATSSPSIYKPFHHR